MYNSATLEKDGRYKLASGEIITAAQHYSKITELTQQVNDQAKSVISTYNDQLETILSGYDAIAKSIEQQTSKIKVFQDSLSQISDTVKTLFGDDATDRLGDIFDKQLEAAKSTVNISKRNLTAYQDEIASLRVQGVSEDDERMKKVRELYTNELSTFNEAVSSAAKAITEKYSESLKKIVDDTFKLSNGLEMA